MIVSGISWSRGFSSENDNEDRKSSTLSIASPAFKRVSSYVRVDSRQVRRAAARIQDNGGVLFDRRGWEIFFFSLRPELTRGRFVGLFTVCETNELLSCAPHACWLNFCFFYKGLTLHRNR